MSVPAEDLPVTQRHDIYPGIDPKQYYAAKSYANKVVVITGASRGIGEETALQFARSGASVVLIARKQATLDEVKKVISKELPNTKVATFTADVCDTQAVKAAIDGTVKQFGRIDVAIANAGKADPWNKPFPEEDPDNWWKTVEVNIRGVYNLAHFALPVLAKTKGYFISVSSIGAQIRIPFASSYVLSKHSLNRFTEYIHSEYPDVKAFSLHPGAIKTAMADNNPSQAAWLIDTVHLPACTMLRLTSGRDDYLSGRYVAATWDLDEVEKNWKEKILQQDALVNRLHIPN